jgi:hypothetical protein
MTLRCCQLGTVRRLDETSYMSRSVPSTFALQVAATVATAITFGLSGPTAPAPSSRQGR